MRFDLLIRRVGAMAAPALLIVMLAGCGSGFNEGVTALDSGTSTGATASLGIQPPSTNESSVAPKASAKASAKLVREVRALESTVTPGSDGYRIGPQDVLEISVFQAPELAKSVQVAETGMINLPLVGDVQAGGVTARQLEQDLKAKYGTRYLQNPQITVFIREFNSQRVTLEGAVERPGVYPYRGPSTLLQLVASAGGMKEVADGSEVMVFRTANGRKEAARFDVDAIKSGRASDPAILQGDVVIVGTSAIKKLYQDVLKSLPVVGMFGGLL